MADEQGGGQGTQSATGNAGGDAGQSQQTNTAGQQQQGAKISFTAEEHQAELQRETDRRVNEAQRKWKESQDALLADKTKDAETKLAEISARAEEAERFADFSATAHGAGVLNVKDAYLVAKSGGYIDKKGVFDAKRFREEKGYFFAAQAPTPKAPDANAGNGAGGANGTVDMNAWVRAKAGRG